MTASLIFDYKLTIKNHSHKKHFMWERDILTPNIMTSLYVEKNEYSWKIVKISQRVFRAFLQNQYHLFLKRFRKKCFTYFYTTSFPMESQFYLWLLIFFLSVWNVSRYFFSSGSLRNGHADADGHSSYSASLAAFEKLRDAAIGNLCKSLRAQLSEDRNCIPALVSAITTRLFHPDAQKNKNWFVTLSLIYRL